MSTTTVCEKTFEEDEPKGKYSTTAHDIGSTHTTHRGYGRLTIRKNFDSGEYEVYDIGNDEVVRSHTDLETLVGYAQELTDYDIAYESC